MKGQLVDIIGKGMAVERKLTSVGPIAFTANGGANGLVTVSSTYGFKVKAQVVIAATGFPNQIYEVKRVLSKTQMLVGPGSNIKDRADLSAYTLGTNPTIAQAEQDRPGIPFEQHSRAVFEEEPTLANRTLLVDRLGNPYDETNPLPTGVELVVENVEVKVDIDAFKPAPDSVLGVGTENGTVSGIKHVLRIDSELDLRVKDKLVSDTLFNVDNKIQETNNKLDEVNDNLDASNLHLADIEVAINDGLSAVNGNLDSIESKLDDVNLNLDEANESLNNIESKLDDTNTKLDSIDGNIDDTNTKLDAANISLDSIESKLDTVNTNLDDVNNNIQSLEDTAIDIEANTSETNNQLVMANSTLDAIENALSNPLQIAQPIITAGTEDGTPGGPVFVNVNNIKQQILAAHDREQNFVYADFGTKDQRIIRIDYVSPTFSGVTASKVISYTQVGNRYRRDSINWIIS